MPPTGQESDSANVVSISTSDVLASTSRPHCFALGVASIATAQVAPNKKESSSRGGVGQDVDSGFFKLRAKRSFSPRIRCPGCWTPHLLQAPVGRRRRSCLLRTGKPGSSLRHAIRRNDFRSSKSFIVIEFRIRSLCHADLHLLYEHLLCERPRNRDRPPSTRCSNRGGSPSLASICVAVGLSP